MARGISKPLIVLGAALVVVEGLLLGYGWTQLRQLREENGRLMADADELARLRAENRELQKSQVDTNEIERLRRQAQEVHKLRGQYQELQQLKEQYAELQQKHEELRAANQQLTAQQQSLRSQFQSVVAGANRPSNPAVPTPSSWLGISIQSLANSPQARSQNPGVTEGVVVAAVIPNTPAENSGLVVGDIIRSIDGQPVATPEQLRETMATKRVGQRVVVEVYRGGVTHRIGVIAAPYPTGQ